MGLRRTVVGCICLLFLGALVWAGCAPGGEEKAAEDPIETIEVDETEFSLEPADITLEEPGTYVFEAVNSGGITHALEIEGEGIEEETENLEPGESAELEVNLEPGIYELYCPVGNHEERGMTGTITVREG